MMVRFGSGSVVEIFDFVRFGSVRNGPRIAFEFGVFGSGSVRFPSLV